MQFLSRDERSDKNFLRLNEIAWKYVLLHCEHVKKLICALKKIFADAKFRNIDAANVHTRMRIDAPMRACYITRILV